MDEEEMAKLIEEEIKEIRERIKNNDFPQTKAEALKSEFLNDFIGAGLFWGLVSAPRRHSHSLAKNDVIRSIDLLGLDLPNDIFNLPGLVLAQIWYECLKNL
jgi:hypothetical protein